MSYNFSPCYRCGGKVENDFLGRIRCTKCGYDFLTMSIDPDFVPQEEVCEFCEKTINNELPINTNMNLSKTFACIASGTTQKEIVIHINDIANQYVNDIENHKFKGTYGIPINFCPMCGRKLTEEEDEI